MPPEVVAPGDLRARLAELSGALPLHPLWSLPELFTERVEVDGLVLELVGLVARSADGAEAVGSAAESGQAPLRRAYFELLERTSTLAALRDGPQQVTVLDETGLRLGECGREEVFPQAPADCSYRYALTNGVAAATDFTMAARSAAYEAIERDRILRSWYGLIAPLRLPEVDLGPLAPLQPRFRLEVFELPATSTDAPAVAGVLGFPESEEEPLIRGTGAGKDLTEALARASRECAQTLGFLWGESVPAEEPAFGTSAEYHQEYYLWAPARAALEAWLNGNRLGIAGQSIARMRRTPQPRRRYADLTPRHLRGRVWVVKSLSETELPLVFGSGHPAIPSRGNRQLGVHPIS